MTPLLVSSILLASILPAASTEERPCPINSPEGCTAQFSQSGGQWDIAVLPAKNSENFRGWLQFRVLVFENKEWREAGIGHVGPVKQDDGTYKMTTEHVLLSIFKSLTFKVEVKLMGSATQPLEVSIDLTNVADQ
jgi:hypothetical protein